MRHSFISPIGTCAKRSFQWNQSGGLRQSYDFAVEAVAAALGSSPVAVVCSLPAVNTQQNPCDDECYLLFEASAILASVLGPP